eukprot:symbB.v1.2.038604.t1/scaffold6079.1/size23820/1
MLVRQERADVELDMAFPMYVVSLQNVLSMTGVRPHEDLLRDGLLDKMDFLRFKAMFISHQWVSAHHPDPEGQQLKVFQAAMVNLLNGSTEATPTLWSEILSFVVGWRPHFATTDISGSNVVVWYDYFSIPQDTQIRSSEQGNAINSIPAYIDRCEFFVVLCPALQHATTLLPLNHHSWAERGWCRTEVMSRLLSVEKGSVLYIESPEQVTLGSAWLSTMLSPGGGTFTVPSDREVVGKILREMVRKKLHSHLITDDFPSYRLLLNQQQMWLRECGIPSLPGLVTGDVGEGSDEVEILLIQHGFIRVSEYDKAGWTPLCYAALGGNPQMIEALLKKRADPNQAICKNSPTAFLFKGSTALSICSRFGNNEAMRILLRARANLNHQDTQGCIPLHFTATLCDNAEGARLLLEAGADPCTTQINGTTPFQLACVYGATKVVKELLHFTDIANQELHSAIIIGQASPEHLEFLFQIGCDINGEFDIRHRYPLGIRLLCKVLAVKHCVAPTWLNTFLYYVLFGPTPLMIGILVGDYEVSKFLLKAKARVDLRCRGHTAFDIAVKLRAPDVFLQELLAHGARSCNASPPENDESGLQDLGPMVSVAL